MTQPPRNALLEKYMTQAGQYPDKYMRRAIQAYWPDRAQSGDDASRLLQLTLQRLNHLQGERLGGKIIVSVTRQKHNVIRFHTKHASYYFDIPFLHLFSEDQRVQMHTSTSDKLPVDFWGLLERAERRGHSAVEEGDESGDDASYEKDTEEAKQDDSAPAIEWPECDWGQCLNRDQ